LSGSNGVIQLKNMKYFNSQPENHADRPAFVFTEDQNPMGMNTVCTQPTLMQTALATFEKLPDSYLYLAANVEKFMSYFVAIFMLMIIGLMIMTATKQHYEHEKTQKFSTEIRIRSSEATPLISDSA